MIQRLLAVVFAALVFLPVQAPAETVQATGMAFFEPGREALGREKALEDAKRLAIESAVGAHIESATEVSNFMVVRDRIMSRAAGYLDDIRILKEEAGEYGSYEVTIEADVRSSQLVGDLDRLARLLAMQNSPRVHVAQASGLPQDYRPAADKAVNRLIDKLSRSGFTVVASPSEALDQPLLVATVSLELDSSTSTFQDMELTVNEVSISTAVHRAGDGRVLATASAVETVPGDNRLAALDKGARECVLAVWKSLAKDLTRVWEQEVFGQRELLVTIKNVPTYTRGEQIAGIFASDVAGVAGAEMTAYRKGLASFRVHYKGRPDFFVDELTMAYFQNAYFTADVIRVRDNRVELKLTN